MRSCFRSFLLNTKQVDCCNKLTSFTEIYPCYEPTQKADIPGVGEGEGTFCKSQLGGGLEYCCRNVASDLVDKEFNMNVPLSWVISCSSEEDAGSGAAVYSSPSPQHFGFYFPRRSIVQFEDSYSSLLDGSPRRQVPIGLNHQAEVPLWDPQAMDTYYSGSDYVVDACGGQLMEGCVFLKPDPELSAHSDVKAGDGRKDCLCPDRGSVRCVRQLAREAWERLIETLGHGKFVQLGFSDMGRSCHKNGLKKKSGSFMRLFILILCRMVKSYGSISL